MHYWITWKSKTDDHKLTLTQYMGLCTGVCDDKGIHNDDEAVVCSAAIVDDRLVVDCSAIASTSHFAD